MGLRGQKRRRDKKDDHIEEKESRYGIGIHIYAVRRQWSYHLRDVRFHECASQRRNDVG